MRVCGVFVLVLRYHEQAQPRDIRRAQLNAMYSFWCHCPLCEAGMGRGPADSMHVTYARVVSCRMLDAAVVDSNVCLHCVSRLRVLEAMRCPDTACGGNALPCPPAAGVDCGGDEKAPPSRYECDRCHAHVPYDSVVAALERWMPSPDALI